MSLSSVIPDDVLERLSSLEIGDFTVIASAISLGYSPHALGEAIMKLADGGDPSLPAVNGNPRPLTINAWSFVNDKGQYQHTYGLSSARAGELKGMLLESRDDACREISAVVTARLRARGSERPLIVSLDGMPGGTGVDPSPPGSGKPGKELKQEIVRDSARYGQYTFVASDTNRSGSLRFRVHLGKGFYAVFQNKVGAVDVARIARVKGRFDELVSDHICLWPNGAVPRFGSDIPEKYEFDCILPPSAPTPPEVGNKAATAATEQKPSTTGGV